MNVAITRGHTQDVNVTRVSGSAGSGKTAYLLGRAHRFLDFGMTVAWIGNARDAESLRERGADLIEVLDDDELENFLLEAAHDVVVLDDIHHIQTTRLRRNAPERKLAQAIVDIFTSNAKNQQRLYAVCVKQVRIW